MIPKPTESDLHWRDTLVDRVQRVSAADFDALALDIFRYQFTYNSLYRAYALLLGKDIHNVRETSDIPFLPISFFRQHLIQSNDWEPGVVFESSTTTGQIPSRHAIRDMGFYRRNAVHGFAEVMHRNVSEFIWLALLPSYVERPHASLVSMVSYFIAQGQPGSRFISPAEAQEALVSADNSRIPVACIGVSFALLSLAETAQLQLHNTLIIETGGMKGRLPEITRDALHDRLKKSLGVTTVAAEYGMTELLSQAWSMGHGRFRYAPTLQLRIRALDDPMELQAPGERGVICCIDLANVDTCAFIATDDIGVMYDDETFEVLGRIDASELRGCNLMYVQ